MARKAVGRAIGLAWVESEREATRAAVEKACRNMLMVLWRVGGTDGEVAMMMREIEKCEGRASARRVTCSNHQRLFI